MRMAGWRESARVWLHTFLVWYLVCPFRPETSLIILTYFFSADASDQMQKEDTWRKRKQRQEKDSVWMCRVGGN